MSNIYYWEKLTSWKLVRKVNFSYICQSKLFSFEEQKDTRYIRGNVYFSIIVFSFLSSTKLCLRFLLIYFVRKILLELLTKWGWFQGHHERFPKYLGKKLNFQKPETRRWKSTDNNNINISPENTYTFLFEKEKT